MKNAIRIILPAACLLAAAACSRSERTVDRERVGQTGMGTTTEGRTGETTVTGANVGKLGNDVAIRRIVEARCARETTCMNVGAGKHYASSDACMNNIRGDMKDDLNANECPHGIDSKELDECLAAIKAESCNNPIEKLSRVAACRTSDLCLATSDKNR